MSFSLRWERRPGDPGYVDTDVVENVEVNNGEEISAILARITNPTIVHVTPPGEPGQVVEESMAFGLGHPERAAVEWDTSDAVFYGYEPDVLETSDDIIFMYGLDESRYPPYRTRVSAETAVKALREYVETGHRPTCVQWEAAE